MENETRIRNGENADVACIVSNWMRSFRGGDGVVGVSPKTYEYFQHKILEELLPRSVVRVMCNADREHQILGWICAEPTREALVVHMAYTKKTFRGIGVAKRLLADLRGRYPAEAVAYTHKTRLFWRRAKEEGQDSFFDKIKKANFVYHPYLVHMTMPKGWEDDDAPE